MLKLTRLYYLTMACRYNAVKSIEIESRKDNYPPVFWLFSKEAMTYLLLNKQNTIFMRRGLQILLFFLPLSSKNFTDATEVSRLVGKERAINSLWEEIHYTPWKTYSETEVYSDGFKTQLKNKLTCKCWALSVILSSRLRTSSNNCAFFFFSICWLCFRLATFLFWSFICLRIAYTYTLVLMTVITSFSLQINLWL